MSLSALAVLFPHEATTRDITVRVAVSYLAEQSAPENGRWFWSYHIRLENGGPRASSCFRATGASWMAAARCTKSEAKGWSAKCR
jgi:uncharacterized protein affecting Mg2+/Co2+ transport